MNLPNSLTVTRIFLVPLLVVALLTKVKGHLILGVPKEIVEGLQKIGHKTSSVVGPLGGGQAIWIDWDKGTLTGGSDPRKDGCALGY